MKRFIKKIQICLVFLMLLLTPVMVTPFTASAAPVDSACEGLKIADPTATCDKAQSQTGFSKIIQTIINVLSILVGAISVVMIIIGGLRYVLSSGDSASTKGAKDTIMYALIGLVVVLFAQVIVRFVLSRAS